MSTTATDRHLQVPRGTPALHLQPVQRAAGDLAEALGAVLAELPGTLDAAQLARRLNVNLNLPRRVLAALAKSNPLEMIGALPGDDGMRLFLEAAAHVVSAESIARARAANAAARELVRSEVGRSDRLAQIVAVNDVSARESLERRAKRASFKAMSQWYGHHARVRLVCYMVRNSAVHSDQCELATVAGAAGLEQCGSVIPIPITTSYRHDEAAGGTSLARLCALNGEPVGPPNHFGGIPEFSTHPLPAFAEFNLGGQSILGLAPSPIPFGATLDYFFGLRDREPGIARFSREPDGGQVLSVVPTSPYARLVLDVYVHRETWLGVKPELGLFRLGSRPTVVGRTFDERAVDRFSVQESVESLGYGIAAGLKEMPQYAALMRHCFASVGWQSEEFALYRCSIEFPLIGLQVAMRFLPPLAAT